VAAGERVKIYELPAATVASTVHHGGYSGLTGAYRELMGWISASGYTIVGPEREIYHRGPATPGDQNDADCVTEIQFPVEKAA
jgi:effector-binding domain-containing protein